MKRLLSIGLVVFSLLTLLTACKDRVLFSGTNYNKHLELADYKGITVDTDSDDFKELYQKVIAADIENNNLYSKKTEGKVANGDTANIDYVGKKDGVAFDGGTAEGYDLIIGSHSFIDGFEEGLIGAEIGKTVDLNLTFPQGYHEESLAGKAVVFTVTVNYVNAPMEPKDYYKELGHKTLAQYENEVKDKTVDEFLIASVIENSKVNSYPEEDVKELQGQITAALDNNILATYNMSLEAYIAQNGATMESFNKDLIDEQIKPLIDQIMPFYAIADKEDIEVSSEDIDKKVKEVIKDYKDAGTTVTADDLNKSYGEYYFENIVVQEKVLKFIRDNAKIK